MRESSDRDVEKMIELFKSVQKNFRSYMMNYIKDYGFTIPQIMVIFQVMENPGITLQELSDKLELAKSTMSGIIDRLEAKGVVIRERPDNNRRIVNISLSKSFMGYESIIKLKEELKHKYFSRIVEGGNPGEIQDILSGLEKLNSLMLKMNSESTKK